MIRNEKLTMGEFIVMRTTFCDDYLSPREQ